MNNRTRYIATAGMIAAIYVVISLVLLPISFGIFQVRVAEALTVLPFITPAASIGLFVGCMLANVFGGNGLVDIIYGSLITLIAAFATRGFYHLNENKIVKAVSILPCVLLFLTGVWVLTDFSFEAYQFESVIAFLFLFMAIFLIKKFANRSKNDSYYMTSLTVLIILGILDIYFMLNFDEFIKQVFDFEVIWETSLGIVAIIYSLFLFKIYLDLYLAKEEIRLFLAPLPPVVLNAFGVSYYLAPIIGVDYWFAVQFVGIGQLISCYVIGLPLLLILRKRQIFN